MPEKSTCAINPVKATWKLTANQRAEIVRRYTSLESVADLAVEYGLTQHTVRKLLARRGIKLRPGKESLALTEDVRREVLHSITEGKSLTVAVTGAGISYWAFWSCMKKGKVAATGFCREFYLEVQALLGGVKPHARMARQYTLDEGHFEQIDTEEKAYILGFAATDGYVSGSTLGWKLQVADYAQLEKIRRCLGSNAPIRKRMSKGSTIKSGRGTGKQIRPSICCEINFCSERLANDARKQGIVDRKTFVVKPWVGPDDLMPAYWRGVIDGDGTITFTCKEGRKPRWCIGLVGNPMMIEGLSRFAASLTGKFGYVSKPSEGTWVVSWRGNRIVQKLAKALYENASISLDRKQALAERIMATKIERADRSELTLERLAALKEIHGTWRKVATSLNITEYNLNHIKRNRLRSRSPTH